MNDKDLHIDFNKPEDPLFGKGKIIWGKTEAEVWANIDNKLSEEPEKVVSLRRKMVQWAAAAVFLLLAGFSSVVSFYSRTVECLPGERVLAELPDGSTVDLNSGSKLMYYPLKWFKARKLKFEGEGYFNVKKGSKFTVESVQGSTMVLGTSFNIYARDDKYRVTCLTGKVKVSIHNKETAVLTPNKHVVLEKGKLVVTEMFETENAISWTHNNFFFEGNPLIEVIDEIERRYAVTIHLQPQLNNRNFVSNFSKEYNVEKVLEFVCKTMGIKFVKQSENVYLVVEES